VTQEYSLSTALNKVEQGITKGLATYRSSVQKDEVGRISSLAQGIVWATGLESIRSEELVQFAGGALGLVLDILPDRTGIVLLDEEQTLKAGDEVLRTGRILEVPVGHSLIGRVVDPLGRPLDGKGTVQMPEYRAVQREAPAIMDRGPVSKPLQTGIKVIDALIPIGRGQRELILGDRQTGKTALALDAIINQAGKEIVCVYCAVGQRSSSVAKLVAHLKRYEAINYSIVVVAPGNESPGLQFIAPYSATSIAEFFMEKGRDVLVVYDDLTKHALAYRQISLLLRRPPGREAYPGDIFYIHSRLLERSVKLAEEKGGGSITSLPIVETEAQNISAYIPTNLISITDGQVYLSPELFQKGIFPAVDVGRSVSRVGGKAQLKAYRKITAELRLSYSQFQELESFARFGTRLDTATRKALRHGRCVREILKQEQFAPLTAAQQIAVLLATNQGLLDDIPLSDIAEIERAIVTRLQAEQELCTGIISDDLLERVWDELGELLRTTVEEYKQAKGLLL